MDLFVAFFSAIVCFVLALFVYNKNTQSATNVYFSILIISLGLYPIFNYLVLHSNTNADTLFWTKLVMISAIPAGPFFYFFVETFPSKNFMFHKKIQIIFIIWLFINILLACLGLIFQSAILINGKLDLQPGPAIASFGLLQGISILAGSWALVRKYRSAKGILKLQLRYIAFGIVIGLGLMLLATVILPNIFRYTTLIPVSPLFLLIATIASAYSIVRARLLDIRLIVARSVAYFVLLFLIVATFTVWLFFTSALFFKNTISTTETIFYILIMLAVAFLVDPVKAFLETFTDKIFFKGNYISNTLVFNLTQIMASTLLLSDLTQKTLNQLLDTMRITRGAFILFSDDKKLHVVDPSHAENIHIQQEAIKKLYALKRIAIIDEEEDEKIKQMMRDLNVVITVPLYEDGHDEGLLVLGEKKSGEIYSQQDIDVLEIFGPEVSVALHNAESYEEISKFNITLKKEIDDATKDLRNANEKLKQLDKLKNEFVSVASHELRTPMTAIKSYLWMALEGKGGKLNEKQKYYIDRGYKSVDRLIRLVNDMLNISRIESGRITIELQKADLLKMIQEVVDEVLPRANELSISIIVNKPDSLPYVLADQDKIKEVLFNLIGNSLKFTPKDGTITVSFEQKDGFIKTKVTDTGAGIAPEDMGKLFQKFGLIAGSYATNQTSTSLGTGLGLYICKSIINLHHGEITVSSEGTGKGSTFAFTLKEFKESDMHALKTEKKESEEAVDLIHTQV